jgi:hypothetical protein
MFIVAPTGITNDETFLFTPRSFWTVLRVTGIVAALEDVENAKMATSFIFLKKVSIDKLVNIFKNNEYVKKACKISTLIKSKTYLNAS